MKGCPQQKATHILYEALETEMNVPDISACPFPRGLPSLLDGRNAWPSLKLIVKYLDSLSH